MPAKKTFALLGGKLHQHGFLDEQKLAPAGDGVLVEACTKMHTMNKKAKFLPHTSEFSLPSSVAVFEDRRFAFRSL
jgi:hypothetical protein